MNKRVLHQEYLQMWLNGEDLERKYLNCEWEEFDCMRMTLDSFNYDMYEFRKKPKLVKVDMEKFKSVMNNTYTSLFCKDMIDLINQCIVEEQ